MDLNFYVIITRVNPGKHRFFMTHRQFVIVSGNSERHITTKATRNKNPLITGGFMSKNILILEGSPRKRGNSNMLAEQAAAGAREAGAQVEVVSLHGLKIAPCNGCDACLKTGICTIKDDMQDLSPKVSNADGLILASPIYWYTYSAQLKTCIDRWYALWNGRNDAFKGKPVGFVLTFGDIDVYTSGAINAIYTLDSMFRFLEADIAGWVYGSLMDIGDAAKNPELMQRAYRLGMKIAE
jgi:multimeric flavodoxin WrbA